MWYILNSNHDIIQVDAERCAEWFSADNFSDNRRVGLDYIGSFRVSTVFLGIDHGFGDDTHVLFETTVFKDINSDLFHKRYKTWDDSVEGHAKTIESIANSLNSPDGEVRFELNA